MALEKNITTSTGFNCPTAYYIAEDISLSYKNKVAVIVISGYKDKLAKQEKRDPLEVKEYRIFGTNEIPAVKAKYSISVSAIASSSGDTITLDLNGDALKEVTLTEGIDFLADGTVETAVNEIIEALNLNTTFNVDWTASIGVNTVVIEAKVGGVAGNKLIAGGTGFVSQEQTVVGADTIPSDFDKYFSPTVMNSLDVNILSQAYTYLKTLPDFQGSAEVADV